MNSPITFHRNIQLYLIVLNSYFYEQDSLWIEKQFFLAVNDNYSSILKVCHWQNLINFYKHFLFKKISQNLLMHTAKTFFYNKNMI